jgi:hypothetical protein
MAEFEFTFQGKEYVVNATNNEEALRKLQSVIGGQAAGSMLPSPVDFGPAPPPRENVFGDVTSQAMEAPLEAMKYYAGRVAAPDRNILQRAGDVGMTALTGLGTGLAAGAGTVAEIVAGDTTQEKKLARDLMMGLEVAVPELAGPTSAGVRMARQVTAGKAIPKAREFGEITPRMEAARAAEELGVLPTAGMQGPVGSMLSGGLEASPISGPTIQRSTERVISEMKEAADDIASKAGVKTTTEAAGEALQVGSGKFVNTFEDKAELLFNRVDNLIGKDSMVVAPNTAEALKEISEYAASHPEIAKAQNLGKFVRLYDQFRGGGSGLTNVDTAIPYGVLKDLRSTFGKSIGKISGPLADMDQGRVKMLYGKLSDDMRLAAESSGPDALRAFQQANGFYSRGREIIDGTIARFTNANTPQQAYNNLQNMLIQGNVRQSTAAILNIKKALPKDDFNTFRSTLISNLGKATAGAQDAAGEVFSPNTFLTNYNRMNKSSRKVVFGELDAELAKLAKVAEQAKDASANVNRSRTGVAVSTAGLVTLAATGGLKAAVIAAALNYGTAVGMTSKPFLKALNAAAKKDMGPLQRLAGGDGLIAAEAKTILRALAAQQATQEQ